ncbi:MAG: lactate utilization protein [Patescibacteria group bacterium]
MKYSDLAPKATVERTKTALQQKGYEVIEVASGTDALGLITKTIPRGASIMNGTSTTLEQIGYLPYLREGNHEWRDLHALITNENDKEKRTALRRESTSADFYLGSVHAVTESGDLLIASNTGSQLSHLAFTSPNIILVVGTHKIVPTLTDAMNRLEEYVLPLESERSIKAYGVPSQVNKILLIKGENPMLKRHIRIIFVNERLGF